jgi:ankyrin repeat protein
LAALNGHEAVVQLLLKHEMGVGMKNNNGLTALECAARNGHKVVVLLLLKHKAYALPTIAYDVLVKYRYRYICDSAGFPKI